MGLQECTGFASKDRPWLKWHEPIANFDYEGYDNFFEYFKDITGTYGDGNICLIEYNGFQLLRNDILEDVEAKANQLHNVGIGHGTIVSLMMLNTPEVIILLLALAKIGAICNLIKYDETPERVNEILVLTQSEYIFFAQLPFLAETISGVVQEENSIKKAI